MAKTNFRDIYLERVDASKNVARFYAVSVQTNLFGEQTLIRMFGRINKVGRVHLETFDDAESAAIARADIIRKKLKRGYCMPA